MDIVERSFRNLDSLIPRPHVDRLDLLTEEIVFRTGAVRMRQITTAFRASLETKKLGGQLQGLCIPIKHGKRADRGLKYHIVVDPNKCTDSEDVDPWVFLVGHEIGHIVSNSFGTGVGGYWPNEEHKRVEAWCSEFGRSLGRKVTNSRR